MRFFIVLILSIFLFSCGSSISGAPECDDRTVKDLAKSLYSNIYKSFLIYRYSGDNIIFWNILGKYNLYDDLKKSENKIDKERVDRADKEMSKYEVIFDGIRLEAKDDVTRKIQCITNVDLYNKETKETKTVRTNLLYTAQYTEDGQVYVEIKKGGK